MTAVLEDTLDAAEAAGKHVMCELNSGGDTRIMWDADNDDEVAVAQAAFDDLRSKGYIAYHRGEGRHDLEVQCEDAGGVRLSVGIDD